MIDCEHAEAPTHDTDPPTFDANSNTPFIHDSVEHDMPLLRDTTHDVDCDQKCTMNICLLTQQYMYFVSRNDSDVVLALKAWSIFLLSLS